MNNLKVTLLCCLFFTLLLLTSAQHLDYLQQINYTQHHIELNNVNNRIYLANADYGLDSEVHRADIYPSIPKVETKTIDDPTQQILHQPSLQLNRTRAKLLKPRWGKFRLDGIDKFALNQRINPTYSKQHDDEENAQSFVNDEKNNNIQSSDNTVNISNIIYTEGNTSHKIVETHHSIIPQHLRQHVAKHFDSQLAKIIAKKNTHVNNTNITPHNDDGDMATLPFPTGSELSSLLKQYATTTNNNNSSSSTTSSFTTQQAYANHQFTPLSDLMGSSNTIPKYIYNVLRREGQFNLDSYLEAGYHYQSWVPFLDSNFNVAQPPTLAKDYPRVTIQFYYPASSTSNAYYGEEMIHIGCTPDMSISSPISIVSDAKWTNPDCTNTNHAKPIESSTSWSHSALACFWSPQQQMYFLQVHFLSSTVQIHQGRAIERHGYQLLFRVSNGAGSYITTGRENVQVRPTDPDMTISQQRQPSSSTYKLRIVKNPKLLAPGQSSATYTRDTIPQIPDTETPLGSNVTFTFLLYDAYTNPIVPIRIPDSLEYWPTKQLVANPRPSTGHWLTTASWPERGLTPTAPLGFKQYSLTDKCRPNWTYNFRPYVADTRLLLEGKYTDSTGTVQVHPLLSFNMSTYTILPPFFITTPKITKSSTWVNRPLTTNNTIEINQQKTDFTLTFNLREKFGNILSFTTTTSPTPTDFVLITTTSHPNCPIQPICNTVGCCNGIQCTLRYTVYGQYGVEVRCYYAMMHTTLYRYPGTFFGELMDVDVPNTTGFERLTVRLTVDPTPWVPNLTWQCQMYGSNIWINDCTVNGLLSNLCNTGLNTTCSVEVLTRRCADSSTNIIYPSGMCQNIDNSAFSNSLTISNWATPCTTDPSLIDLKCPLYNPAPNPPLPEYTTLYTVPSSTPDFPKFPVTRIHPLIFLIFAEGRRPLVTRPSVNVQIYTYRANPGHTCKPNTPSITQQPSTCVTQGPATQMSSTSNQYLIQFDPGDEPIHIHKISCFINGVECNQLKDVILYATVGEASLNQLFWAPPTPTQQLTNGTMVLSGKQIVAKDLDLYSNDYWSAYRAFKDRKLPFLLDVPEYIDDMVISRITTRELLHRVGEKHIFYLSQADALGNEVFEPFVGTKQMMVLALDRGVSTVQGEALSCSNYDLRYTTDNRMGSYDANGKYIPNYYQIPTFSLLSQEQLQFWHFDQTICFWDSIERRYRVEWSTTEATPLISGYTSSGQFVIKMNYRTFYAISADMESTTEPTQISSKYILITVAPGDVDFTKSDIHLWYTDVVTGNKALYNNNPTNNIIENNENQDNDYYYNLKENQYNNNDIIDILQDNTNNNNTIPTIPALPVSTQFSWEARLYDEYKNKIFPIVASNELIPDALLSPIFVYNTTTTTNNTNIGVDPRKLTVQWLIDNDDTSLYYSIGFTTYGALKFNVSFEYYQQIVANYTIHTHPDVPIAVNKINYQQNATRTKIDNDPVVLSTKSTTSEQNEFFNQQQEQEEDDNNNTNINNNNDDQSSPSSPSYLYIYNDVLTLQTYDMYGNISPIPGPDYQEQTDGMLLSKYDLTAAHVILYPDENNLQLSLLQQQYCPKAYCLNTTDSTTKDDYESCCNPITGQCEFHWSYSPLPLDDVNINNMNTIQCSYQFGLKTKYYNFMNVTTMYDINNPYYLFNITLSKDKPSIYQTKCIIAENTDNIAISELYIESLQPLINQEDQQRIKISQNVINCNQESLISSYCTSTSDSRDFMNNIINNIECPIYITKKVCWDDTKSLIVNDELCITSGNIDKEQINNPIYNELNINDMYKFQFERCNYDEAAFYNNGNNNNNKRLDLLCAYDYSLEIDDDSMLIFDDGNIAFNNNNNNISIIITGILIIIMSSIF